MSGVVVMLDQSLGSVRELEGRSVGLDLTPAASVALGELNQRRLPVVLMVDRRADDGAYAVPGVEFADVIPRGEDLAATLIEIAERLGIDRGIYVASDRVDRGAAVSAGWMALPHVSAASAVAAGRRIRLAWLSGRADPRRLGWILPYEFTRTEDGWHAVALVDEGTIALAAAADVEVAVLDADIGTEDLLRVHVDGSVDALEGLRGRKIVRSEAGMVWLALGPDDDVTDIELHGRHGHYVLLRPRPELLDDPPERDYRIDRAMAHLGEGLLDLVHVVDLDLSRLLLRYCWPSASAFQADVDRYSGAAPLDAGGSIASRHWQHADNSRVVDALLADLRDIGYCAYTHPFSHGGTTLHNVIADLPGRGLLVVDPGLLDKIRAILCRHPWPDPRWSDELVELLGAKWQDELRLADYDEPMQRVELEAALGLVAWWPWWIPVCPAPGFGSQIVLVGCHLDSTAASDGGFNPPTDPAPGADDDASGIAAVLRAARYLWQFRGELTHTVRFGFFNVEEDGLAGSGAYASKLKTDRAPVKAVICADMVGFNSDAQRIFEVHAGYWDPLIRDKSVPIAELVRNQAAAHGSLGDGQIYQGTSRPPAGVSDRVLYDGAIDRSDHASFHAQGYGAVVVSEDFFVNLPSEPTADPNPNYHRVADTAIDAAYGADIACAISTAAYELAK